MLASLLFMLAADPATAPVAPPAPTVSSTRTIAAVGDPNKVICHTEEMTGSRLGNVRVCMTKAQWEDRSAQDQQYLKTTQQQGFQH